MPASEERSISDFPSALAILASTLLLVSTYDSGSDTYDSEKVSAVDLASAILGDFEYTQDLATNVKTIFGAINSIMVLSGTTVPSGAIGANGQLYFKYTSSGGTDTVDAMYLKINNAWCEVATGGGGGGASVTLGTTVPSDASGSNGDLYVQYDGTSYAVINYYVKILNVWRVAPYSKVVALTQAQYNQITPDSQTLYIITDAQSSYQTKTDNTLATTDKTVVGAINELKSGKQDNIPNTVAKTVTWDASGYTGDIKAKVYNRVCYISGYFRFSANQSANTQLLHVSDVTLAMDFFESAYTDGSTTVRFKFTTDGKLINENQLPSNQWVSISLACLIA